MNHSANVDRPHQRHARPLLKTLLALCLLSLGLLCPASDAAEAKIFKLGGDPPTAQIMIPPEWETTSAETGVEATATGAYLSAELIDADDLPDATRASEQFLADRAIKLKTETKAQKATKVAGLPAVQNDWDATDPDGPTRIRIWIVKVTTDKLLLVFYWRSEAGEKAHAPEVEAIMDSIKPAT